MVDKKYQSFVNRGWDQILSKKTNYYSDSLSLLCLYFMSENWGVKGQQLAAQQSQSNTL